MPRTPTRWIRPRVLVPVSGLLLACALALTGGCGGKNNTVSLRYPPDIVAVTAGDSVALGQGLEIKIHWRSTVTCQSFEGVAFQVLNDTTFSAVAVVRESRDPNTPCTARDTILEGGFVLQDPPGRAFRVVVYGANQQDTVFVQGGTTAAAIERHSILLKNAVDSTPVEGGSADLVDLSTQSVIASLTTDSAGRADTAFACAGAPRAYQIRVVGASGRRATLVFVARPQRCGVAERTWIRI